MKETLVRILLTMLCLEEEEVRAVSFALRAEESRSDLPKIANMYESKRRAHDDCVKASTRLLSRIGEVVEKKVLEISFALKKHLERLDFSSLNEASEEDLVRRDVEYFDELWTTIERRVEERREVVDRFGRDLENLERERSREASGVLKELAKNLFRIAYRTSGEIERKIENEVDGLNSVVVANRRAHAELLALLQKKNVEAGQRAIGKWRSMKRDWRRLRHDAATKEFKRVVSEDETFRNPKERSDLFEKIKQSQKAADHDRSEALASLPEATAEEAAGIKARLREIADAEDADAVEYEEKLTEIAQAQETEARRRRELLRAELHRYGACADEPDFAGTAAYIGAYSASPELEAFFRSAGGLKAELRETSNELVDDDRLMYSQHLHFAKDRISSLLCGADLKDILERQGKSQQLSSLRETLERLRNAAGKKREVLALISTLEHQLDNIALVGGLHEILAREFMNAAADIKRIRKEVEFNSGMSSRASAKSGMSASSKRSSRSSGLLSLGRQSAASKTSLSVASGADNEPMVNMLEVRGVQRRVAVHLYTCDLDPACLDHMRQALRLLDQKSVCNRYVDEVISTECDPLIEECVAQYDDLKKHFLAYYDRQSSLAYERACRVCDFYATAFAARAKAHEREHDIDEKMLDDLYEIRENFQIAHADLERSIEDSSHNLRHAADQSELDKHFASVVEALGQVETRFREYHSDASEMASTYPQKVGEQVSLFKTELCGILLLSEGEDQHDDHYETQRGNRYGVTLDISDFVNQNIFDASSTDREDLSENDILDQCAAPASAAPGIEDKAQETKKMSKKEQAAEEKQRQVHAQFWTDASFEPLNSEEMGALDREALENYLDLRAAKLRRYPAVNGEEEGENATVFQDEETKERYERLLAEVDAHVSKRDAAEACRVAEACREFLLTNVAPVGPNGVVCALESEIPARETVATMLLDLREKLMEEMEARSEAWVRKTDKVTDIRLKKLTEELEDRLRSHWPRTGRLEVSFRQPREGELIMHRQRKQRHVRLVQERDAEHTAECKKILKAMLKQVRSFESSLNEYVEKCATQTSLAGINGLESRCSKMIAAFQAESQRRLRNAIDQFGSVEPNRLFALNDSMLKTSRLFKDGGDYSEAEAQELAERLDALKTGVQESISERLAACEALRVEQSNALALLDNFRERVTTCVHDLSLREGLGQKFGAPRRNAQERLRTEQTEDEARAQLLDDALTQLEELGDMRSLSAVRILASDRANYLDCLSEDSTKRAPREEGKGNNTLRDFVLTVQAECRKETLELYAREKKEGDEEVVVPESLELWLAEAEKKVLGEASYRDHAVRRFYAQIERLEVAVGKKAANANDVSVATCAPAVAISRETDSINDVMEFCSKLDSTTRALMDHLDNLIFIEDLAPLSGEGATPKKRKSLKRLLKARTRKAAGKEDEAIFRQWPGFDAASAFPSVSDETRREEWKSLCETVRQSIPGSVTTAHRHLMKARDAVLADFSSKIN